MAELKEEPPLGISPAPGADARPPLVYSCSGCSSAAQMANHLAIRLDREGVAEMSCIAGVGGGVPGLVKTARSGRRILALDGCVLACARACLAREGIAPDAHLVLADYGVKKRKHADFDPAEADRIYREHVVQGARDCSISVTDIDCPPWPAPPTPR